MKAEMKYLHIWPNEKFTAPYINFINEHFNKNEHLFLVLGSGVGATMPKCKNVKEVAPILRGYLHVILKMNSYEKIYIHSFFSPRIIEILALQPWLLKKCSWIIWGGDLYKYRVKRRTLKSKFYEIMRRQVIRNVGGIITHVEGDYMLAKKWYETKGEYKYSFMYPSNIYRNLNVSIQQKNNNNICIQLGNSADPSNNHVEILKKLEMFKEENILIYCPLSYGNKIYAKEIVELGSSIFGTKFVPLLDFLPYEKYLELLKRIDIAIFNHDRQQAVGNITNLLGMGKKVYLNRKVTTWEMFEKIGVQVYDVESLELAEIKPDVAHKNNLIISKYFSEMELKESLMDVFLK